MDKELRALTDAAVELVKNQGNYSIKAIINDAGERVIETWGEGVTPPSDSELATKKAEMLTKLTNEEYKKNREEEYPDWSMQLDYIYHNGIDKWKTDIVDPVKAKYPKPS